MRSYQDIIFLNVHLCLGIHAITPLLRLVSFGKGLSHESLNETFWRKSGYSHLVDHSPPSADSMRFRFATNVRILFKFVFFTLMYFLLTLITLHQNV